MKPKITNCAAEMYLEHTLRKLIIKPLRIKEHKCPPLCKCSICIRRDSPKVQRSISSSATTLRRQRRFSMEGFRDEFLFICLHLQKVDTICQPLNVRIHDTVFLKDRDWYLLIYFDQGIQIMKNKLFISIEAEKFFIDRREDYDLQIQIDLIKKDKHKKYSLKEFYEMNNIVMQRLKRDVSNARNKASLITARYQTGDQIVMSQYEMHQFLQLSKTNSIFDNLIHLQLYLYDEEPGILIPNQDERNVKDLFIYKYQYKQDLKLFEEVLHEFSTLTDSTVRGQQRWQSEYEHTLTLDPLAQIRLSAHKIAAYIECFHQISIDTMEIYYIIDALERVGIVNIRNVQHQSSENREWKIKTIRADTLTKKIRANEFDMLKEQRKAHTERTRILSEQLTSHTQKVIDRIKPITQQMEEENKRDIKSDEAFQILNPKMTESIAQILKHKDYEKLLNNFPSQLERYTKSKKVVSWKKKEENNEDDKPLCLEDYIVKKTMRQNRQGSQSRFMRSISKKFFEK